LSELVSRYQRIEAIESFESSVFDRRTVGSWFTYPALMVDDMGDESKVAAFAEALSERLLSIRIAVQAMNAYFVVTQSEEITTWWCAEQHTA